MEKRLALNLFFLSIVLVFTSCGNYPKTSTPQVNWETKDVVLKGSILNFEKHRDLKTITFIFSDIIDRKLQKNYVAEIDSTGSFELKVPLNYPQDFYLRFGSLSTFLCAPGDSLIFEVDADIFNNRDNEKPNGKYFARVTGGNRIKENEDLRAFFEGRPDTNYIFDHHEKAIKEKTAEEYRAYINERETAYRAFLKEFRKEHSTESLFDRWAEDYLKYDSWPELIDFPEKHARKNKLKNEEVVLPAEYYSFLRDYNMNDHQFFTTKHADFLYQYNRYVLSHPKDSADKASKLFKEKGIIHGARILSDMIKQNTSGFTKNLVFTKFYLDAIDGHQIREFEALYDSTNIDDPYFRNIVLNGYENLKKYIANQITEGTNLQSIDSKIVKDLVETISSKYTGRVIYIDFWAPWCSPCMQEMAYSAELQKYYKNKDVVFLFLGNQCKEDSWKATIANKKLGGEHILLNDDQYTILSGEFGITGIPHYVLIDKKGNIVSKNAIRPSQKELIRKQIDVLL